MAAAVAWGGPAHARTMQQKLEAVCAADIAKVCPDKPAGSDALKACMLIRRAQVSAACMALIDNSE